MLLCCEIDIPKLVINRTLFKALINKMNIIFIITIVVV